MSQRSRKNYPEKGSKDQTQKDDHALNNDETPVNDRTKILDQTNDIHKGEDEGEAS